MSLKSFFAIPFAKLAIRSVKKWANNPHHTQKKFLITLSEKEN